MQVTRKGEVQCRVYFPSMKKRRWLDMDRDKEEREDLVIRVSEFYHTSPET